MWEQSAELFSLEQLIAASAACAEAYEGIGLTADEIWVEVMCDSMGGMNIFAGEQIGRETVKPILQATKAVAAQQRKNGVRGPPVDDGYSYELDSAEFRNSVTKWEQDGMPSGERFVMGSTGNVLQGLGAIEQDIYINGDKIRRIIHDHGEQGITTDIIKKIPEILNDPILILRAKLDGKENENSTRMVLFGSVTVNKSPVLVVLDLRPVENHVVVNDMQRVTSAYIKDSNPVRFVTESKIMYADKKRATRALRSIGFQMPIELARSGFIGSIEYSDRIVKLFGEPFSEVVVSIGDADEMRRSVEGANFSREVDVSGRELSEGQDAYFRDSQVRDEDGRLLVVYHGINADRSVTVLKTGNEGIRMLAIGRRIMDKADVARLDCRAYIWRFECV